MTHFYRIYVKMSTDSSFEELSPGDTCVEGDVAPDDAGGTGTQSVRRGYSLCMTDATADMLYDEAGKEEPERPTEMVVLPSPHILTTQEERMVCDAKAELSIKHDLDNFQVQSCVALLNGRNVVVVAPCGSGKLLVFYLGVHILKKKLQLPHGVGICLQPLNNILHEKTNNNPVLNTAYLTMNGEAVKTGDVKLSHSLEELLSEDISCLLGHAESFMSVKGNVVFFLQILDIINSYICIA